MILYDKDNCLKELLARLKVKLQEIGATRIWIGSKWYWKLKHGYSRERVRIGMAILGRVTNSSSLRVPKLGLR